MKNHIHKYALQLGMISLTASLIMSRFFNDAGELDFFIGFFGGLSVPLNILGAVKAIQARKANHS